MSYKILISKKADKELKKIAKANKEAHLDIVIFIENKLTTENPCTLPNAKHLQGFNDNRYRWRIGEYRIIGIVENGITKIIKIIKIAKKDENTYKGL